MDIFCYVYLSFIITVVSETPEKEEENQLEEDHNGTLSWLVLGGFSTPTGSEYHRYNNALKSAALL